MEKHLLDVLAAVPGTVLDERWLAAIAGVPDAGARLERWTASGLVESVPGAGYRAPDGTPPVEQARSEVVDHAVRWAEARQGRAHRPAPTVETLRRIQADCAARGEWHAVLALGSVLDPSYAQSGRWDAWHQVLTTNLTAARAMGDRAAEALALHQLVPRALPARHRRRCHPPRRRAGDPPGHPGYARRRGEQPQPLDPALRPGTRPAATPADLPGARTTYVPPSPSARPP